MGFADGSSRGLETGPALSLPSPAGSSALSQVQEARIVVSSTLNAEPMFQLSGS